jgi:hypothetical protein
MPSLVDRNLALPEFSSKVERFVLVHKLREKLRTLRTGGFSSIGIELTEDELQDLIIELEQPVLCP